MQALVEVVRAERLPVQICAVVANRSAAEGLPWAHDQGINTKLLEHNKFASRADFDAALGAYLETLELDYILLAGFMRVLGAPLVKQFSGKIINIHPSLLPVFPGLATHAQALAAGVQWHGCTLHFVTPVLDQGPIIAQGVIPVLAGDTPEALAARLLPVEHALYVQVLRWLAEGRVQLLEDATVQVQGQPHRAWLGAALCP